MNPASVKSTFRCATCTDGILCVSFGCRAVVVVRWCDVVLGTCACACVCLCVRARGVCAGVWCCACMYVCGCVCVCVCRVCVAGVRMTSSVM